jgi:N-acetylmuramoyl-L-alanine amidase
MTNGFSGRGRQGQGRQVGPSRSNRKAFAGLALAAAVLAAIACGGAGRAGEGAGPARADASRSEISTGWFARRLSLGLWLDRPVPFRAFTLDAPPRLVLDFAGLDWSGFSAAQLQGDETRGRVRVGRIRDGWSRMVVDLPGPLALRSAEIRPLAGGARLEVRLARAGAADFAARSGAPPGAWPGAAPRPPAAVGAGEVTVAIDPGHGGIDPGALRAGVAEKDVVLAFAEALRDALVAAGFRTIMTREGDDFLPLDARVGAARAAGADLLLSIHTNASDAPGATGAIVFTRSERGSNPAAADRARQENAADSLAGLATVGAGDPVRAVLAEMARAETDVRSAGLADSLVAAMAREVGLARGYPRQSADFQVLRSPEMPSVLVELGFLSNPADRADLTSPAWRARAADAVRAGIEAWLEHDAALSARFRR